MSERRERYSPLSSSTSPPPLSPIASLTGDLPLAPKPWEDAALHRDAYLSLEQEYKESVLHCNKGGGLDRRGGQARLTDVMESAHLMPYSSEVKYHKPKRITAHLALFDLLLFTTSSTLCTTADYLIISPQVCSQHENTCIL